MLNLVLHQLGDLTNRLPSLSSAVFRFLLFVRVCSFEVLVVPVDLIVVPILVFVGLDNTGADGRLIIFVFDVTVGVLGPISPLRMPDSFDSLRFSITNVVLLLKLVLLGGCRVLVGDFVLYGLFGLDVAWTNQVHLSVLMHDRLLRLRRAGSCLLSPCFVVLQAVDLIVVLQAVDLSGGLCVHLGRNRVRLHPRGLFRL